MRPHDGRSLVTAESLQAELNPVGPVETLLVERLISTLDRLENGRPADRLEARIAPLLDALRAARGLRSGGRRTVRETPAMKTGISRTITRPTGRDTAEAPWVGRLVFDPDVSEGSPVVRGTWITVAEVVSLVVDGWSWAEILRTHPELEEDDLRACLSYSVEEEGAGAGLIDAVREKPALSIQDLQLRQLG